MGRAAGESPWYRLRLMRGDTPSSDEAEGLDLISVTSALKVLNKPALVQWGFKLGLQGVAELAKEAEFFERMGDPAALEAMLKERGLTPGQKKEAGGTRGSSVHHAFEDMVKVGAAPVLDAYPEEERGYITALLNWVTATQPVLVGVERFVFDLCDLYAGTLDYVRREEGGDIGHGYAPPRLVLGDLKTSKGVYPEMHLQLAAYQHAWECDRGKPGRERITDTEIVLLKEDGTYEVVPGRPDLDAFRSVLAAYRWSEGYDSRGRPKK